MGTLYDMKAFYRWLEKAEDRELVQRRDGLARALEHLTDPDVIGDARFLLKKIEEEMLARELRP